MTVRVSIVGATGYTGGELLRYLVRHPQATVTHVTSENYVGQPIHHVHKFLKGRLDLVCEKVEIATIAKDSDIVFLGLPHGAAAKTAAALLEKGTRVIDLSADFRIKDKSVFEQWYGKHPVPSLLKEAVYGLPERYRKQIAKARLVANPGCYATTSILAGLPLVASAKWLGRGPIIVDAKSGVSGAGRKLDNLYLFSEADENMQAYALKGHRHHPEILQEWEAAHPSKGRADLDFTFVPHLVPMNRGIFSTVYLPLAGSTAVDALHSVYVNYYAKEPFVTVLAPDESPEIKSVTYTNACQIGVAVAPNKRQAIVMAVTDNLVKGASGQAIQNMNLMAGFDETNGLL